MMRIIFRPIIAIVVLMATPRPLRTLIIAITIGTAARRGWLTITGGHQSTDGIVPTTEAITIRGVIPG